MNKVLIITNECVAEIPDRKSRPWIEFAEYIKKQGGEMYSLDEIVNICFQENEHKEFFANKPNSHWVPCWSDKQKTIKDYIGVGFNNKYYEGNFL